MRLISTVSVIALAGSLMIGAAGAAKPSKPPPILVIPPPVPVMMVPPPPPPPPPPVSPPPPPGQRAVQITGSITPDDYPPAALRNEESGAVIARYEIGVDGRVTRCNSSSATSSPVLEDTTCQLIARRFRFRPAQDAAGNPVPEIRTQRVIWNIPEGGPPVFEPNAFVARFTVQPDGTVTDCVATGSFDYTMDASDYCTELTKAEPIKDAKGNPVARRVEVRAATRVSPVAAPRRKRR